MQEPNVKTLWLSDETEKAISNIAVCINALGNDPRSKARHIILREHSWRVYPVVKLQDSSCFKSIIAISHTDSIQVHLEYCRTS